MSARGRYAFLRERIKRKNPEERITTASPPPHLRLLSPKKGRTKNKTTTTTTRVALFPEEINEDKRSNRAKRDEHSHLQFSSRWRVHQHGVLVSLRGHFQALRQGRRTQRDRSGGGGGGGGGFDTTNARSSRNSGVSLREGGSGLDRYAQRQRRHPLFTVVWNEL